MGASPPDGDSDSAGQSKPPKAKREPNGAEGGGRLRKFLSAEIGSKKHKESEPAAASARSDAPGAPPAPPPPPPPPIMPPEPPARYSYTVPPPVAPADNVPSYTMPSPTMPMPTMPPPPMPPPPPPPAEKPAGKKEKGGPPAPKKPKKYGRPTAEPVPGAPAEVGKAAQDAAAGNARLQKILKFELTAKKVKPMELMHFCRYMSVFLTAGIPVLEALETVRVDAKDKKLKEMIGQISSALRGGDNFATAVAAHHRAVPAFFVSMIRASEETGQLATVLGQMSGYIERDIEAKRKTKSALVYPLIVIGLSSVSVAILVGFVLPRFVDFFEQFDAELPLPTRMLMWISETVSKYGPISAGLFLLMGIGIAVCMLWEPGKQVRDKVLLNTPVVKKVVLFAVVERFCRVLASMVSAGVPLPVALELASSGGSNRAFAKKIAVARRKMIEGAGLSGPLAETGAFPTAAVQMLRVGEETGTLEARLEEISNFYGKELEYKLKRLTDMLEPAAVVIVGVIVGFVAVAIISAIYGVFNAGNLQ